MTKISSDELKEFDKDIVAILSLERLESYEGDLQKHFENLKLAQRIVKRLSILEIYLRNKLDYCLKRLVGEEWIKGEIALSIIKERGNISILQSHQILSSLMLGELIRLIDIYKVKHHMFDLKDMDFRKYHWKNRNFFHIGKKKSSL